MSHPVAARLAEALTQAAAKDPALSGSEIARRVERLSGRPFPPQYVSRAFNGSRPLIHISPNLELIARALGLDPRQVLIDAISQDSETAHE